MKKITQNYTQQTKSPQVTPNHKILPQIIRNLVKFHQKKIHQPTQNYYTKSLQYQQEKKSLAMTKITRSHELITRNLEQLLEIATKIWKIAHNYTRSLRNIYNIKKKSQKKSQSKHHKKKRTHTLSAHLYRGLTQITTRICT